MEMLTKKEAAKILAVSEHTLDNMLSARKLPFYRVGPKAIRLDRADLERYLESVKVDPCTVKRVTRTPARRPCAYTPGMEVV